MKELQEKRLNFLRPDGSQWFDITEEFVKYEKHLIRLELGGNDGIHKINEYELS
jgi:hypothetical protein